MDKLEIKNILMSMKTQDNEQYINYLLGKVDMLSDKVIFEYLKKMGDSEENIRDYFNEQIKKMKIAQLRRDKKYPINKLFTYGISGSKNCIHLHLPNDLHESINKYGLKKTMDIINLYLLDAINKIKNMKDNQFPNLNNINSIYMISPLLLQRELQFLEEMDFNIHLYHKKDLANKDYVSEHPEALLASHIFGTDKNVGTATINLNVVSSENWQDKTKNKIKEFNNKGIFIEENENIK